MRIKVNINEPNEAQNIAELQGWAENHPDNVEDYFVVAAPHRDCLMIHLVYKTIFGSRHLFVCNSIKDVTFDFSTGDFTLFCKWLFHTCDDHFGRDYEIIF